MDSKDRDEAPVEGTAPGAGVGLHVVPESDKERTCRFCHHPAVPEDSIDLGPLYEYTEDTPYRDNYRAHFNCLLFSSGLEQNGDDDEQMKGFLTQDILREWKRGQRLKCASCDKRYATAGCAKKKCAKTFHLPCAIRQGAQVQYTGTFATYCPDHKERQKGILPRNEEISCGICLEIVEKEMLEGERLWAPCCGGWFHRSCVVSLARSTGYFFKCSLCNNKDSFEEEMKRFGIFVPEQDAAWEQEPNAFDSLLERHNTCDAEHCLCPLGREEDEDYTNWEILLCKCCGAQGCHIHCAGLIPSDTVTWTCPSCLDVIKAMPPTLKNVYHTVRRRGLRERLTFMQEADVDDDMRFRTEISNVVLETTRPYPGQSKAEASGCSTPSTNSVPAADALPTADDTFECSPVKSRTGANPVDSPPNSPSAKRIKSDLPFDLSSTPDKGGAITAAAAALGPPSSSSTPSPKQSNNKRNDLKTLLRQMRLKVKQKKQERGNQLQKEVKADPKQQSILHFLVKKV